jgi:glycosyltransferase involved in cell wall biosynthesis
MILSAVTPVYNEKPLVRGCIESLKPFIRDHIFCVSQRPYFGENQEDDGTAALADELGATVIRGVWPLDHMQRNTGIALLQDVDWIICTDVDMWMTKADMEKLTDVLSNAQAEAFVIPQIAYWKDTDHVLVGDDFKPVIAIRPHVRFVHIGNIGSPFEILQDIYVHHINWCEPKDIYKKVTTYSHAPEFDGEKWYRENYLTWEEGQKARLPTGNFEVAYQPLPDELKVYL